MRIFGATLADGGCECRTRNVGAMNARRCEIPDSNARVMAAIPGDSRRIRAPAWLSSTAFAA